MSLFKAKPFSLFGEGHLSGYGTIPKGRELNEGYNVQFSFYKEEDVERERKELRERDDRLTKELQVALQGANACIAGTHNCGECLKCVSKKVVGELKNKS